MSLPVVFHRLAERELNGAAAYYRAQERSGLVEAFSVGSVAQRTSCLRNRWRAP